MRIGVVDLFAGAGGFSSGFSKAGFEIVAAIESVKAYSATHSRNFPNCITLNADIRLIDLDDLYQAVKQAGTFDHLVVVGGPPCQSFSIIGRPKIRSLKESQGAFEADHRDYLFQDLFRVVELLKPSFFVMENVPDIRTKQRGKLFAECLRIAHNLGYETNHDVLNAAEHGVPQNRRRVFLVGSKIGRFSFPSPTHREPLCKGKNLLDFMSDASQHPVSVRQAIEDLPIIYDGIREHHLPYSSSKASNDYQKMMRSSIGTVGNNVCRVSNDRAKKVFPHLKPGDKYMDLPPKIRKILPFREDIFADKLKRLDPDRPSWTVIAHIGMDGYMYIHPWENRTLSVREAARIQSFHDSFEFCGNMREQYIQVGNAVPPLLAQVIAQQLNKLFTKQMVAA